MALPLTRSGEVSTVMILIGMKALQELMKPWCKRSHVYASGHIVNTELRLSIIVVQ